MAIDFQKGQKIDIGLSNISVGLGWSDPYPGTDYEFILDASAFMLDANRLIPTEEYFVFYNNTDSPDTALHHTGENPSGNDSIYGADIAIHVNLEKIDASIQEILFIVTIHDAFARKQNYCQARNSYIRIVDEVKGQELIKYDLGEDFSVETAVEFGRLYKKDGKWKFEASGIGFKEDLSFFLSKYYKGQIN